MRGKKIVQQTRWRNNSFQKKTRAFNLPVWVTDHSSRFSYFLLFWSIPSLQNWSVAAGGYWSNHGVAQTLYFKFHLRRINLSNTCGMLGFLLRVEMLLRITLKRWERQSCGTHIHSGRIKPKFSVANLADFRYREESCCREHLSAGYCWLLLTSLFRESFHKGTEKWEKNGLICWARNSEQQSGDIFQRAELLVFNEGSWAELSLNGTVRSTMKSRPLATGTDVEFEQLRIRTISLF